MPWFENWFDTHYYKMLYRHRNDEEASVFLKKLTNHLIENQHIQENCKVLDVGCGRGRHSLYLSKQNFHVTGIDLSSESITEAKIQESELLHYFIKDMRDFQMNENYHLILNLFTSFGYFEDITDNQKVINSIFQHLKPKGIFIMDYLNDHWVKSHLVEKETQVHDDVIFQLEKKVENQFVVKSISIDDHGKKFQFFEKVYLFSPKELEKMIANSGFEVCNVYGNYHLEPLSENSNRCILVARKK